jgi:hypothetical protein
LVVLVFDTISGLPLHALVVHVVVVLLPLMCLVTIAVAVRARWRRYAWVVLGLDVLVFLTTFLAKKSGEKLLARVSQFAPPSHNLALHVQWADRLVVLALGMVVVAAILVFTRNRVALAPYAAVIALVGGLVTIGVTVWVGDTGARAVWGQTIANTKAP